MMGGRGVGPPHPAGGLAFVFVEVFGQIVSESLAHTVALHFLQQMPYGRGQSTGLISVACCVLQISSRCSSQASMIGRRGVGPPHPAGGLALCVGLAPVCKKKRRKVYKMILSLSCLVTLSYSLSHSFSCAGFYKFVVRDDVISPAGVRNFGTYDDVFEHVHSVARVRKNWATVVAYKSGCANGPEAP